MQKVERGRRRCKNKRAQESCTGSFDYLGWADWNAWRRELSPTVGRPNVIGALGLRSAEKQQKDCFRDCDFPSECSWQRTSAYLESVMDEPPVVAF